MADAIVLRSPFAGLAAPSGKAGGVRMLDRSGVGVAEIHVVAARREALAERVATEYGVILPHGDWLTLGEEISLVGIGSGTGLAIRDNPPAGWVRQMEQVIGDCASVVDITGAYGILRLSGPSVADLMTRRAGLAAFKVHQTAVVQLDEVEAIAWRLSEDSFEIATPRAQARTFWSWLEAGTAESGLMSDNSTGPI